MIAVNAVERTIGGRTLFKDVSLTIGPGSRTALVGANGAGKTTLLDIVAGNQQPDAGEVQRPRGTTVGFLRQDVASWAVAVGRGRTRRVLEAVVAASAADAVRRERDALLPRLEDLDDPQHEELVTQYGRLQERFESLGGYALEAEAQRILAGLGFAPDDGTRPLTNLSGGWMMRVALARLLLANPDVLLLDEPTNHLDLESVTWLQGFLADYPGALILVSHDRDFIDACVNRVVEIAGGTATAYTGDYADFVEQRALRMEQLEAAAKNQARKVAATEAFIERFRYKASKARQVQSRVKALDRLERIDAPDQGSRASASSCRRPRAAAAWW